MAHVTAISFTCHPAFTSSCRASTHFGWYSFLSWPEWPVTYGGGMPAWWQVPSQYQPTNIVAAGIRHAWLMSRKSDALTVRLLSHISEGTKPIYVLPGTKEVIYWEWWELAYQGSTNEVMFAVMLQPEPRVNDKLTYCINTKRFNRNESTDASYEITVYTVTVLAKQNGLCNP